MVLSEGLAPVGVWEGGSAVQSREDMRHDRQEQEGK